MTMSDDVARELAPNGVLRVAINTGNFLLVSGVDSSRQPYGVAPDLAREIGADLKLPVSFVTYPSASKVVDAVGGEGPGSGPWDMALVGADPARIEKIAFSPAYVEIEATYLIPQGSGLRTIADVDARGVRIAVCRGSAYELWLSRNIVNAELVYASSIAAARQLFFDEKLDALAGLRSGLLADLQDVPGATVLDGRFMAVQQAVAVPRRNGRALKYVTDFVERSKRSGLIAALIRRHAVIGLSVAGL
jgi:polar amino acid transport system substrate-binding protein